MEKSSFFDCVNDDRNYFASDFASFFSSLVTSGVFPNPSSNLQIINNNNMTVTVSTGKGWISGYNYINDSILILPIETADGVLNRIDRVVMRMDTVGRAINVVVKKGVFASSPIAPVLQRDADGYELALADILISAGVTSIVGANITDQRMNTVLCGWVNSLIQADTTAIFNQYQAWFTAQSTTYNTQMIANEATFQTQFNDWFATIQGQLDGDIAGNLTNAINALGGTGRTTETVKGNADAIAASNINVAQNASNLASHLTDNVKHITAVERTSWTGKIDKSILTAAGDIIYASAANTPVKLSKGADGLALVLSGGLPIWGNAGSKIVSGNYTGNGTAKTISTGFRPKFLMLIQNITTSLNCVLAADNGTTAYCFNTSSTGQFGSGMTTTGFDANDFSCNLNGKIYTYVAIG